MAAQCAPLAAIGAKFGDAQAHRHTGRTAVTGRAVNKFAAAAETEPQQSAIDLGVDLLSRSGHLGTRLAPWQIAARIAGRRIAMDRLRLIESSFAHATRPSQTNRYGQIPGARVTVIDGAGETLTDPKLWRTAFREALDKIAPASAGKAAFSDVKPGDWYYKYVTELAAAGYVSGYGDGTFRPGNNVTIGEALALILTASRWFLWAVSLVRNSRR